MDVKEVQDYIAECVANGIKNIRLICDSLRVSISDIDLQLKKMDGLRIKRAKLTSILESLDDTYRRQQATARSQDFDENSDEAKELQRQVVQLISAAGPLSNREIIANVGNYQEDAKVILSLKWLSERGILAREDNPERRYYQGKQWGEREGYLNGE
jgi:hypothetical protein